MLKVFTNAGFKIKIKLDPNHGRLKFSNKATSNTLEFNETANTTEICLDYSANVNLSITENTRPIELLMSYEILNEIPDSEGKSAPSHKFEPI